MRFGVRTLRRLHNLIRAKVGTVISKMTSLFAQRDSAAAGEAFPKTFAAYILILHMHNLCLLPHSRSGKDLAFGAHRQHDH